MSKVFVWVSGVGAVAFLAGCQAKPDVPSQRDIGAGRPERSDEVISERTAGGPERQDNTSARSAQQRAAADQLAGSGRTAGRAGAASSDTGAR